MNYTVKIVAPFINKITYAALNTAPRIDVVDGVITVTVYKNNGNKGVFVGRDINVIVEGEEE